MFPAGCFLWDWESPLPNLEEIRRFSLTAAVAHISRSMSGRDRRQRTPRAPCPVSAYPSTVWNGNGVVSSVDDIVQRGLRDAQRAPSASSDSSFSSHRFRIRICSASLERISPPHCCDDTTRRIEGYLFSVDLSFLAKNWQRSAPQEQVTQGEGRKRASISCPRRFFGIRFIPDS